MDKQVLEIHVLIDPGDISEVRGVSETAIMIPFFGTADGVFFNGKVLQGAVDRQIVDCNNVKHMSARYMLEGTDSQGNPCRLFVDNEGHFPADAPMPFKTVPAFITDSPVISEYLSGRHFRGEGHPSDGGVTIKFFEF